MVDDSDNQYGHGGRRPGAGAPKGNTNALGNSGGPGAPEGNTRAVTHGLYADVETLYGELNETETEHVDAIYDSLVARFKRRGGELDYETESQLFRIAMMHMKRSPGG